jgi:hypothetical protein
MINTIIAILVEKGFFTEAEGEALADKVRNGTLPADYKSAARQVKAWLEEVEKGQ